MNYFLSKISTYLVLGCLASVPFFSSLHADTKSPVNPSRYPKRSEKPVTNDPSPKRPRFSNQAAPYKPSYNSSYKSSYKPSYNHCSYMDTSVLNPSVINPSFGSDVILIDLCDLNEEQLFEGYFEQEDTSFIIRCDAGTQLVIDFDINCPYFHIGDQSGNGSFITFTVDKTFYTCNLWVEENSNYFEDGDEISSTEYYVATYFSDDLEFWESAEDFFGFKIDLKCVKACPNALFFSFIKEDPNLSDEEDL